VCWRSQIPDELVARSDWNKALTAYTSNIVSKISGRALQLRIRLTGQKLGQEEKKAILASIELTENARFINLGFETHDVVSSSRLMSLRGIGALRPCNRGIASSLTRLPRRGRCGTT
jgi:hypothetical protein